MVGTTQRARRAAHVREEILRAAARVFGRRGFAATRMQDIAAEAGYTVASLYAYFHGKQQITEALIAFLAEGVLGPLKEPTPKGLAFGQQLELVLRRQLEFAEGLDEGLMVLFAFKSGAPQAGPGRRGRSAGPGADVFLRELAKWIERSARPQDIGGRKPRDVACVLKAIMQAIFLQWLHGRRKGRLADRAPLIADLFLHGVAAQLPAREGSAI